MLFDGINLFDPWANVGQTGAGSLGNVNPNAGWPFNNRPIPPTFPGPSPGPSPGGPLVQQAWTIIGPGGSLDAQYFNILGEPLGDVIADQCPPPETAFIAVRPKATNFPQLGALIDASPPVFSAGGGAGGGGGGGGVNTDVPPR